MTTKAKITLTLPAVGGADDYRRFGEEMKVALPRAIVSFASWNVVEVEMNADEIGQVIEWLQDEGFFSTDFKDIKLSWS